MSSFVSVCFSIQYVSSPYASVKNLVAISLGISYSKLIDKPQIPGIKQADVGNAVFDHQKSVYAAAESKTAIPFQTDCSENIGMHQTGAHHFKPAVAKFDIHFNTGFNEGKEARPETDFRVRAEILFKKMENRPLQMGERDFFVHVQSIHLKKLGLVGGIGGLI